MGFDPPWKKEETVEKEREENEACLVVDVLSSPDQVFYVSSSQLAQ